MNRFLLLLLFLISPVISFAGGSVLAYLDGKPVTYEDIKEYVSQLPGEKYKKMLETRDGLKKLVNYYIDREIILEEAKKTVSKKEGVLRSHSGLDQDAAYIIAYLTKEINERVEINQDEVKAYAKEKGISEQKAYAELLSRKRRELFKKLLAKLKKKHKIKVLIK